MKCPIMTMFAQKRNKTQRDEMTSPHSHRIHPPSARPHDMTHSFHLSVGPIPMPGASLTQRNAPM